LLQDFVSLKAVSGASIVQTATNWVDLGDVEDLVLITDVRDVLNSPQLAFDTAATAQDAAFVPIVAPFSLAVGLQTNVVLASFAGVPPARFLRWRLLPGVGAPSQATFRIWCAAYRWA
jgi:hypothetical protein